MSDKPPLEPTAGDRLADLAQPAAAAPASAPGGFLLPDHRVLALTGRDAVAFAQAQTMNDVAGLAEGHWQWNGWLTPKGRLLALFALLRTAPDTVWWLLPDADPQALAERLRRFVFRSKVAIEVRDDLRVSGAFAAPASARGARLAGDAGLEDAGLELDLGAADDPRTLRIGTAGAADDPAAVARWRAFDLHHGLPRLAPDQAEQWTPQQLSLERLHAYSVKKGCYPGQEIVARTHFLGQAKRGLALFEDADGVAPPGTRLSAADDAGGGTVVACAPGLALAVMPAGPAVPAVTGEATLSPLPLLPGLAR